MFSLWFLARALCLALFVGAYDLSRLRLRLFTSRVYGTSLLVSYRPLAAWLIVEAKNTANSANSHRSAARIRRSTRSVLCATLTGICND